MLTDIELREIRERKHRAEQVMYDLCNQKPMLMSIPPKPYDDDQKIFATFSDIDLLITEVYAYRELLEKTAGDK